MIKQTIYPKTARVDIALNVIVTEKLDGSNLGIGKYNGELYLFQRNTIFNENELIDYKQALYKGLYDWFIENKEILREAINDETIIFGEWIGTGHIKYNKAVPKYNLFAKAKLNKTDNMFELTHLNNDVKSINFAFKDFIIPNILNIVPIVFEDSFYLDLEELNEIYDTYCSKVERQVEGLVIYDSISKTIKKYVRLKNGKLKPHFTWEKGSE